MPNFRAPFERPPDSFLPQGDRELLRLELYMVGRINEERATLGLSALTPHALLAAVARAHSAEMRDRGYFAHESSTTHLYSPADRYEYAFGQEPRFISENISWRRSGSWVGPEEVMQRWLRQNKSNALPPTQDDVEQSHIGLMNSPGHRANILEPSIDLVGVGIVSRDREIWVTQMFVWREERKHQGN